MKNLTVQVLHSAIKSTQMIAVDIIITTMDGKQVHVPSEICMHNLRALNDAAGDSIDTMMELQSIAYSYINYMQDNGDISIAGDAFSIDAFQVDAYVMDTTKHIAWSSSEL